VIKIRLWKEADSIRLSISNAYDSRFMEEMKHCSTHPYQVSEVLGKNIDGLEVGLCIARYVVSAHRGDMKVSAADQLFSVTISLPMEHLPDYSLQPQFNDMKSGGLSIVHGCPLRPVKEERQMRTD